MSQSTGRPRSRRPVASTPKPAAEEKRPSQRRTRIILAAVVIGVLGLAGGIGYYFYYVMPLQHTIIKVNDAEINIDYFVRRMLLSATDDVFTMIETITHEELIKQGAPRYGIEVTEDELMEELRNGARGENETISEAEFKSWYRDQRNESGLSDTEFKDLVRTTIMGFRLQQLFAERVSTVAEQVHLHYILFLTYEDAVEAVTRLEDGEDFADLARELSIDEQSAELGGDMGWWPLDALGIQQDTLFLTPPDWMFNLGVGQVSEPTLLDQESMMFAIFMVSERATARDIDEDMLEIVKGRQIEKWLSNEMSIQTITLHGRNNGFDSETHAWITWQISRRQSQ
jgi:foldase protein PrsA